MEPRSSTNHWSPETRDPGVPGGDVVVVEADRRVVAAADQQRSLVERDGLALVAALEDHDLGRARRGAAWRAWPAWPRLALRRAGRGRPPAGHPGAEHVGADHRDAGEHEDPQDREVARTGSGPGSARTRRHPRVRCRVMVVLPILIVAPSARVAFSTRLPLTRHAVGRAQVVHADPRLLARSCGSSTRISMCRRETPGSLTRRSASLPRPIDDARRRERQPLAVELEGRGRAAYLGVGGVAARQADLAIGLAAHPEPAGGQVLAGLQGDADRSGEDVGLLRRRARAASRSARGAAAARAPRAAAWSGSESSTWKSLGASRRSRLRICAELSTSRVSAEAISTGWTALRKVRAKTPEIICSSLFSKRCSPLIGSSSPRGRAARAFWRSYRADLSRSCAPPSAGLGGADTVG